MHLKNSSLFYQLSPEDLIEQTLSRKEGFLDNRGALCIHTGKFSGRSPKDKFIVLDSLTGNTVDWNEYNKPIDVQHFNGLYNKITDYFFDKPAWIRDAYACADPRYRIKLRVVTETPAASLFAYNMFIRPVQTDMYTFDPEWLIVHAPGFKANPATDGVRSPNFAIINFSEKVILIGGTGYTGEIKKGVFTVLNFMLPLEKNVLSMHCSANKGEEGDTAIFFGLSGTGKTTLSTDPRRRLIGDDEHGWADDSIFNFEGGCYAKTIHLSEEKEPEIYKAIRKGALLENITFLPDTNEVNFNDSSITENTRVSYPLHHISNAVVPSFGKSTKNIFFLTCDAFGVLPPVARLTPEQAMYQFISGYTAKVAGTETGILEPQPTFSACFGAAFLPLHPGTYAALLGEKMQQSKATVWLVNTGWIGGSYGVGKRIKLSHTRSIITAILQGAFNHTKFRTDEVFGMAIPEECPDVPSDILNPGEYWTDKGAYDKTASHLVYLFNKNFEKYKSNVTDNILMAVPKKYNKAV